MVVIDSVAALTPKAEIEGEMGDSHVGLQARLMSQALRKLTGNIKRSNTLVVFINQIRMKIGVMFGSPETTTGGNALKFYASVRLDIRRTGAIKKGDEVIGNETRVKVVRTRSPPRSRTSSSTSCTARACRGTASCLDYGVRHGIVEKSGAWYGYGSDRIGQGRDNARRFLKEHPETADAIEATLRERMPARARRTGGARTRASRGPGGRRRLMDPGSVAPPPMRPVHTLHSCGGGTRREPAPANPSGVVAGTGPGRG